ncbi:MAG: hemolysin family protein [Rhodospirillaceae bacterium]|nr:hemolysin family protein [Rhodospirillaceae bacterium]
MLIFELLIVLALTLFNGLLAMSELAVVSSRRARLDHMAQSGSHGARIALRLMDDPGRFLSTVQIGITLVGILAGAYSGATLAEQLGAWLNQYPVFAPNGEAVAIGLVVLAITYLSLIVGELVPKRIAMNNPEAIAVWVAQPMHLLSQITAPVVWLLRTSTEAVLKTLRLHKSTAEPVSEEDVKSLVAEGTRAGTFEPQEKEMIEGVLRLADRSARSVMTPRTEIFWIDPSETQEELILELEQAAYSRLLVCDGTVDRAIGTVKTKDILATVLRGKKINIQEVMEPSAKIPEDLPLLKVMELFRHKGVHMAIVVDEYQVTQGIITTTDILESIAGNIPERGEDPGPSAIMREDGSWLVDGALPIDEFEDRMALRGLSDEGDFETVAGFALHHLKNLPKPGESFNYGSNRFEILDMDGRRIDKILVSRI